MHNNRAANIWLAGVRDSIINNNNSRFTDDYRSMFAGHFDSCVCLTLADGGEKAAPTGNQVNGNRCKTLESDDQISGFTLNITDTARGNRVRDNVLSPQGRHIFQIQNYMLLIISISLLSSHSHRNS